MPLLPCSVILEDCKYRSGRYLVWLFDFYRLISVKLILFLAPGTEGVMELLFPSVSSIFLLLPLFTLALSILLLFWDAENSSMVFNLP